MFLYPETEVVSSELLLHPKMNNTVEYSDSFYYIRAGRRACEQPEAMLLRRREAAAACIRLVGAACT